MSVLSTLQTNYKNSLTKVKETKIAFDIAESNYTSAVETLYPKEVWYNNVPTESKRSRICPQDGNEYFGPDAWTANVCQYLAVEQSGGGWQGINQYATWGYWVQSSGYIEVRDKIFAYRKALQDKINAQSIYDSAKDSYDTARIISGKAKGALDNWNKENLTPEQIANTINEENKSTLTDSQTRVLKWIGIAVGLLIVFYLIIRIIKR